MTEYGEHFKARVAERTQEFSYQSREKCIELMTDNADRLNRHVFQAAGLIMDMVEKGVVKHEQSLMSLLDNLTLSAECNKSFVRLFAELK
ncbi:TPA: hypothetical protein SFZ51_001032 [Campylobacter jejuni]|nr:hypothetical protein [Campylobacter jejuni]HEG8104727.1 hypothetical protein [Campylobacter jejuni]HEG8133615.1 hypothetical protein [Campylobacter jejuni]